MTTTIGSLDLNAFSDLYSDSTQYFWFEPNASATYGAGAHVTLVPDTSFISNPTGQNILMNTDGFSIRNGLLPMMTLDNDSLDFNVVDTTAGTYVATATFTSTGAQIGQSSGTHIQISSAGFDVNTNSSTNIASFGIDGARIGQRGGIHATIESNSLALKIDNDRLFEVKSDGIFNNVYFGASTKAEGANYTNSAVFATYEYLNNFCMPDANMEKIVTTEGGEDTGYTLEYDASSSQAYGDDVYDVLDASGAKFRSAQYYGIQYCPNVTGNKFRLDFILSGASEYQGAPVLFSMGNAQIYSSGDTVQITNVLKAGKDGAIIYDDQVFQVDSGNGVTAFYINSAGGIYFNASSTLETLITQLGWDADLQ